MKSLFKTITTLSVLVSSSAALAQTPSTLPPKPQIVGAQQAPQQMTQMLSAWGFQPTVCQGNAAEIRHSVTGETACVQPNGEIGAGQFVYDSASNQIRPDEIPLSAPQENSNASQGVPSQDPSLANMVFTFTNKYDYGTCIDAILLMSEGRGSELQRMESSECTQKIIDLYGGELSRDLALQLIDLANFRATEILQPVLYPTLGLRQRVAISLGYIYDVDQNNSEILEYAETNNF